MELLRTAWNEMVHLFTLSKQVSITIDGAPALVGKKVGLIKHINHKVKEDHPQYTVLSFHCD